MKTPIMIKDQVLITSECNTQGLKGVVIKMQGNYATVRLYNGIVRNYNKLSLAVIPTKEEPTMNNFTDCLNFAHIQFINGSNPNQVYAFANYLEELEVGDTVVCDTVRGFSIGKVVTITDTVTVNVQREIVQRVDTAEFKARQAKRELVAELKTKIDARVKELQTMTLYEMLAEKDEELASMLKTYKEAFNG